jgi:DNA modification methylase
MSVKTLNSDNQRQNKAKKSTANLTAKVELNIELSASDLEIINNLRSLTSDEDLIDFDDYTGISFERKKKNMVKPGDLWLLGQHKLLCSDGMNPKAIDYLLDSNSVEMVFTDPLYLDYVNACDNKIGNDNFNKELYQFLLDTCQNILRVCNGAVYICIDSSESHILHQAFIEAGGDWPSFIIWIKNNLFEGMMDYHSQYETILYGCKKGNRRHWWNDRDKSDVWTVEEPGASESLKLFGVPTSNDLYPTVRSRDLAYQAVANSSKVRDIVLDPFAGSGSTLIACEDLNRSARLIEASPGQCETMIKRWEMSIARKAILLERGLSFK